MKYTHLIDGDPAEGQSSGGGLEREGPAGRHTDHVGRTAGLGEERADVFDLALDGVREGCPRWRRGLGGCS